MTREKTIKALSERDGRVYVMLSTPEMGEKFLRQAEAEGFTFCDGKKPTERHYENVMAVNPDMTINYVGTNGRIAYGSGAKTVDGKELIRVAYDYYIK
mgnify:CR=1 FL=1